MMNAICPLQIEGQDYEIAINVGSMVRSERETGKSFMELVKEVESGNLPSIAFLLAQCLRKDKKPVGMDFISEMDFEVFQELFEPLIDTLLEAFPAKKESDKKKVIVLKKAMK